MDITRNVEIEIKLKLESFTDYLKLMGFLGSLDGEKHHESGFFDTEDRKLSHAGWALRVRVETDRGLVTVKGVSQQSGAAVIREEIEAEIDRGLAMEILGGFVNVMELEVEPVDMVRQKVADFHPVKYVCFQNDRQIKFFTIGDYDYLLEIDKTTYSDGSVDYELEVEVSHLDQLEVVEDRLKKMFDSLGIPYEKQVKSKLQRALERI